MAQIPFVRDPKKFVQFNPNNAQLHLGRNVVQLQDNVPTQAIKLHTNDVTAPRGWVVGQMEPVRSVYTAPQAAQQALQQMRDTAAANARNANESKFVEQANVGSLGAITQNQFKTLTDYFTEQGYQLDVRKYTATKNAPQFLLKRINDVHQRAANGKPETLKQYFRQNRSRLDFVTAKAIQALIKINSANKMYRTFSKHVWLKNNVLTSGLAQSRYANARIKRRYKNAVRRVSKNSNVAIANITPDVVDDYILSTKAAVLQGAQTAAAMVGDKIETSLKGAVGQNVQPGLPGWVQPGRLPRPVINLAARATQARQHGGMMGNMSAQDLLNWVGPMNNPNAGQGGGGNK